VILSGGAREKGRGGAFFRSTQKEQGKEKIAKGASAEGPE